MADTDWYRPTGMGYTIYVPANQHRGCDHPYVLNCASIIVSGSAGNWYWVRRVGSREYGPRRTGFRTQSEAKTDVETRFLCALRRLLIRVYRRIPVRPHCSAAINRHTIFCRFALAMGLLSINDCRPINPADPY